VPAPPTIDHQRRNGLTQSEAFSPRMAVQNLSFFASSLLALRIRRGQSDRDQTPDSVGTRWKAGLPATPFINVPLPLQLKSKTDDWSLPNPRATALFSLLL
jgi:hypothetical protein